MLVDYLYSREPRPLQQLIANQVSESVELFDTFVDHCKALVHDGLQVVAGFERRLRVHWVSVANAV